jgi:hypothetical protein
MHAALWLLFYPEALNAGKPMSTQRKDNLNHPGLGPNLTGTQAVSDAPFQVLQPLPGCDSCVIPVLVQVQTKSVTS